MGDETGYLLVLKRFMESDLLKIGVLVVVDITMDNVEVPKLCFWAIFPRCDLPPTDFSVPGNSAAQVPKSSACSLGASQQHKTKVALFKVLSLLCVVRLSCQTVCTG